MEDKPASNRPRILVVDDDLVFCSILEEWLGTKYKVLVAHDGEEALRLATEERPAVIILDVMLPKLSGTAVAWALKNDARFKGVPVIFISGRSSPSDSTRSVMTPEDAYVTKPISLDYLSAFLRQHIPEALQDLDLVVPGAHRDAERRASPRVSVSLPGRLLASSGEHEVTIVSLSLHGAFVECEAEASPDEPARLLIPYGGDEGSLPCTIVYRAIRDGRRGMGLHFQELSSEHEALLVVILTDQAGGWGVGEG